MICWWCQTGTASSGGCRGLTTGSLPPAAESAAAWIGLPLSHIPDAIWNFDAGSLLWRGQRFDLSELALIPGSRCILLRRENLREQLMTAALDLLPDSIQLYDAESRIQFFNRASKHLIDIPPSKNVEGQPLLDVFAVDPEYSTTLTALRTRAPVRGRWIPINPSPARS